MRRLALLGLLACHHTNDAAPARASAEAVDTVVGRLQVAGVGGAPRMILLPGNGKPGVTLAGPESLARVDGLEISVIGRASGSQLAVEQFAVIAANGVPATDGRLIADGGTLYLVTADGARHPLVNPSPNLRANVGHRVWVSGPLDREPVAYGIIQ